MDTRDEKGLPSFVLDPWILSLLKITVGGKWGQLSLNNNKNILKIIIVRKQKLSTIEFMKTSIYL